MRRTPILIANWKMHKTASDAESFVKSVKPRLHNQILEVGLAVPFPIIASTFEDAIGSSLKIGAQNIHHQKEGPYTGEVSAHMVRDAGASFVLLGHSERRQLFHEDNQWIGKKIEAAIKEGLHPMLCIGETEGEREEGKTEQIIQMQLRECLAGFSASQLDHLMIAYEPVWAIGTGRTATPELAEEMHLMIRQHLDALFDEAFSRKVPILYGGSVKPENAASLLQKPNIDGALVGGASLDAESFLQIIFHVRDVIS